MREITEQEFDEYLDEIYPPFYIGEVQFFASDVLKNCDPIAYRVAMSDYESYLEEEEQYA